jgi:hypothetical protein
MLRRSTIAALSVAVLAGLALPAVPAGAAETTGSISGVAFEDTNRNGVRDAGEAPMANHVLYVFDVSGAFVSQATTASDGAYRFASLAPGDYKITYASSSWWSLRDSWVPTTTPSLRPEVQVTLGSAAFADFGWRPLLRSSDAGSPMTSFTAPDGLRVLSYNDAVPARQVHDALRGGSLLGKEASSVVVRFALTSSSTTSTAATQENGVYTSFSATVNIDYTSWLDSGDRALFHEYGHAWSLFHAYMTQGDTTMSEYRSRRGLAEDARVDSGYSWNLRELIAEDYRQLFGSTSARAWRQANGDIPPAGSVPGLREWLASGFTAPPATPEPAPAAAPLTISGLTVNPAPVVQLGTISFSTSSTADLVVTVVDQRGTAVRTVAARSTATAGSQSFTWDRRDDRGRVVKKGSYRVTVQATDSRGAVETSAPFSVA